jgi:hypothetical protein
MFTFIFIPEIVVEFREKSQKFVFEQINKVNIAE